MKACLYIRVSTDEQVREGVSLDMQEERCREVARAAGATDVTIYRDEGYTGTNLRRPGLRKLLSELDGVDAVYVWKLSRLSRNLRQLLDVLTLLSEHDVGLVSVTERFDLSSPFGKAALHILATFNELQADIIRENVCAALDGIARSGRWPGGDVYGYQPGGKGKTIIPIPEEAKVVGHIFRWCNRGWSLAQITQELNRRKVPCKRGGVRWTHVQVKGILGNPLYTGKMRWHGGVIDGNHEPLISVRLYNAVARRLRKHKRFPGAGGVRSLTPLLRCGICGGAMGISSTKRAKREVYYERYLRCKPRVDYPPDERHAPILVAYEKVAAVIWRHTELLFSQGDIQRAAKRHRAQSAHDEITGRMKTIRQRLAEVDDRLQTNLEAAQRGLMPLDLLEEDNVPLMREREQLYDNLADCYETIDGRTDLTDLARISPQNLLARFRDKADNRHQLTFLSRLYSEIRVWKHHVEFHYRHDVMAPERRPLPHLYAPRRGIINLGF